MFRLSNFYSLRLGLLGLCILAAAGIGCSEAAAPAPPVDCEAQCPCACGQRGTPSQTPPSPAPVMPERGHTYAVFLAGNVRVAEGKIPLALAQKKVEAERERLKLCFLKRLEKRPELKGEVGLQFTVSGPTGLLIAAVANEDTLKDAALTRCLVAATKTWTFEPQKTKAPSVVKFDIYMSGVDFNTP